MRLSISTRLAAAGLAGFAVVGIAGCSGGSAGGNHAASNQPPSSPPSTRSASTPAGSNVSGASNQLTGFGATIAAWNAHHQADSGFDPGSSYDPDPVLGRGDEHFDDKYYAVTAMDGRELNYSMRFPSGTSVSAAKQIVLAELPRDARVKWFAVQDTCAQELVVSRTLARAVGGNTAALAEFSSGRAGDHYTASDVWEAILTGMPASTGRAYIGC